ncbi:hypothetical protein CCMA1212_001966 [Trichoderma ghanense]|uniref:Uncharacterized protein n=1 Tax=Trichoderma ghanense TaxID=65468 RepID=A0ABY2HBX7_9HYPO
MPAGDANGAMNPSAAPFIPLASSQPSFAKQRSQQSRPGSQAERCRGEHLPPSQDQIPRLTAPTSGRSALENPSDQPCVESPKSSEHVPESNQGKGEDGSAAHGTTIKGSSPSIGPEQHLKSPEAKVSQTHRMSGENIPSDTNNDGAQGNVPQPVPLAGMRAPPPMPLGPYPGYMHPAIPQQQPPYGPAMPPLFGRPVVPPPPYGRPDVPPLPYGRPIIPPPPYGPAIFQPRPPPLPLPLLPPPPPPLEPCYPLLRLTPCQIVSVSTGQPVPDRYAFAYRVTYWPLRLYSAPGTGAQTDGQNPNFHPEEMDSSGSGPLVFGSHSLTPLAQVADIPDGAGEGQTHPTSQDETSDIGHDQHLLGTSIDNGSKTETEQPAACQSNGQKTRLLSAVDGPHIEEKSIQGQPQPQQDRHVPSNTRTASNSQQRHAAREPAQPSESHRPSCGSPSTMHPPRAVTKSSARYSRKVQVSDRPSQSQAPVEPASWSQSKRWISSETKERKAFQRMMMNLQFMKADQSPFVPKTPAELTKFKISLAEAKRQKLAQEVSILEEKNRQKELAKASGTMLVSQPHVALFNGRDMDDELSPVFAVQNCFNTQDTVEVNKRVEWPSLAELKEDGDRRAKCGRFLPLPRIKIPSVQVREREQAHVPNGDGSIL